MPISHRNTDERSCGASTIVNGQNFVFIDGQLWAVNDDPDSHGAGGLINTQNYVFISGKPVILVGDSAQPDSLCPTLRGAHCSPKAASGDGLVVVNF